MFMQVILHRNIFLENISVHKSRALFNLTAMQDQSLPIIFCRPFLLSEDGIVLPFNGALTGLLTLILKPFGGLSLTKFCPYRY